MKHAKDSRTALVCGADGFIGHHLVKRLKNEGYWVRGVDLHMNTYAQTYADDFLIADLRDQACCEKIFDNQFDEVYQLAADMGGAGYLFTGTNDAEILYNDAMINLNVLNFSYRHQVSNIFYSSSACIYPAYNQVDPNNPKTSEDSAYPAAPDSEYGWEKLFSERLYLSFQRCHGMQIHIARLHNVFGPEGAWNNGKEKSPAAICRKIAMAEQYGEIEIWGDGEQTRSYLYIDECLEGIRRLMQSNWSGPVNIGSEEMISINKLAQLAMQIAGKNLTINHVPGPLGVRGRNSDNRLIKEMLNWAPSQPLIAGLKKTYAWISEQVQHEKLQLNYAFEK